MEQYLYCPVELEIENYQEEEGQESHAQEVCYQDVVPGIGQEYSQENNHGILQEYCQKYCLVTWCRRDSS